MYVDLNQIFAPVVFMWMGMSGVLFFHFRTKQREYLRRFASDGISLDVPPGSAEHFKVRLEKRWVMLYRQTDPELERLRRDIWRQYRLFALWMFGFPLCVVAMLVLLGVSGLVHYR